MTDEIERLKDAFKASPPASPRDGAKKLAIARAMSAFDEKNAHGPQGNGVMARLRETASAAYETLIGRRSMKMNPAFAGGASLAVLTLAVLSANYIQTTRFGGERRVQETPVPAPVPAPASKTGRDEAPKAAPPAERQQTPEIARVEQDEAARRRPAPEPRAAQPQPALRGMPGGALAPQGYNQKMATDRMGRIATMPPATRPDRPVGGYREQGRDRFEAIGANPVKLTREEPVSTFSADVDTASYSFMRTSLNNNVLPPKDAVRVEELINYFPYDYERPAGRAAPFKANVSVMPSPWDAERKLVHIGIAGFELTPAQKPRSNLVFLLDTSGSMNAPNKLPLVVNSLKLLLGELKDDDTVAIVTYAGNAGTLLEPTPVRDKTKILQALDNLGAHGSTAGAEGIRQAYELARTGFDKDGVNRVILATDGDFNVGITDQDELKSYIERQRDSGVSLSVLGFGRGNYNDALMQTLAQNGNGNAAYIDTLNEARKVLAGEASSTLFTIAKDVKLQMEFNPAAVSEYRLIGYETRLLRREDFNNDKVDAGDIGSGHTVTAIYEITPVDSSAKMVDALRYGDAGKPAPGGASSASPDEYGFLKIRYKLPGEQTSKLIETPVTTANEAGSLAAVPGEARFAASVAAFGQLLRGGAYTGAYGYDDVIALARGAKGADEFGYRAEFINLVRLAKSAAALEPLKRR